MLAKLMKNAGITSDVLQLLGFGSVLGSIATWRTAAGSDSAHAERLAIFVGLWAPTFFALAGHVAIAETNDA
jgi:hypothetical protein